MTATIVINIHDSAIELTPEEAKKLYLALRKLFTVDHQPEWPVQIMANPWKYPPRTYVRETLL